MNVWPEKLITWDKVMFIDTVQMWINVNVTNEIMKYDKEIIKI